MRVLVLVAMVVAVPTFAHAQEAKLRGVRGMHVAVIDAASREWQGRLLEVAPDFITIEIDASAQRFALDQIKRVDADGDKVWDGALKGAVFGAVLAGLVVRSGSFTAQAAVGYGLIGLGLDALHGCRHTVYRAPARPAGITVSW